MEAIKLRGTPVDGILSVAVPAAFNNTELEVILLHEYLETKDNTEDKQQKMLSIIGTAKDLNKKFDKMDVYEQ